MKLKEANFSSNISWATSYAFKRLYEMKIMNSNASREQNEVKFNKKCEILHYFLSLFFPIHKMKKNLNGTHRNGFWVLELKIFTSPITTAMWTPLKWKKNISNNYALKIDRRRKFNSSNSFQVAHWQSQCCQHVFGYQFEWFNMRLKILFSPS